MKTLVLFHRLDLTDLFAPVGAVLAADLRIVHLAFGPDEVARLRAMGVTGPITVFQDEIRRLHPSSRLDPDLLAEIDALFLRQTGGAFTLNGALQSDRGFSLLSYDDALRLTVTYHRFWSAFLAEHDANLVVHETCSLMLNFIPAMLCADRGGHYLYAIMAQGPGAGFQHLLMSGFDFNCPDLDRALQAVESGTLPVDATACAAFLDTYRQSFSVFLASAFKPPSLARLALATAYRPIRMLRNGNPHDPVLENIDYWQEERKVAQIRLFNRLRYSREVRFDAFDPDHPYYFYPLHLEPEAVLLYHAHGIYTNQIKLIQNIAAQLPPGVLLYVKDHPHDHGYRSADDYLALKAVPNIRLLDNTESGKKITAHAKGVITLTGTAGFEAMLLGKQVFTLGKTFYSAGPDVIYLRNIRDLRQALYDAATRPPVQDADLYPYLTAYFAALKPGLTDFFAGRAPKYGIDLAQNAQVVAAGLLATVQDLA